VILAAALLWCGCGYRFSAGEARLPGGGRELRIAPVESAVAEAGFGGAFTERLRRVARRAGLELGDGPGVPVLRVRLLELGTVPRGIAAGSGPWVAREEEVRLAVEYELSPAPEAAAPRRLREGESFMAAPDLRGTQANRALAVQRALERLAERIIAECCREYGAP